MISFLIGKISEKHENVCVMDVNGVGFELLISNNTLCALPQENETAKMLTYLQFSENAGVCLYGFATQEEKDVFMKLITVSGVGPKSALGVLSGMKLSDLIVTISSGDSNTLSKVKGLGKKTAERICLELKDKLAAGVLPLLSEDLQIDNINENALNDAVATLINLGVSKNEAYNLARRNATPDATAEEIILQVLKGLGK